MFDVAAPRDQSRLVFPTLTSNRVLSDLLWLALLALLLIATGIGLRDPWPADEPRFALVARDMVATGEWLLPRVGGEAYADKPPLFFWLIAICLEVTRSLRVAFLLPSFLAGCGCVALVYDLGRRLWNRETGLAAGLALLFTVQFVWQARQAQIDATLCFWTTLGLYGSPRHLLLGPSWRWCAIIGWAAAGLGVITKGVGFLPLLVLVPFAVLRKPHWQPRMVSNSRIRWLIGPVAFIAAVSIWLVPMLMAANACIPRSPRIATRSCSTRRFIATATPGIIVNPSGTSSSTSFRRYGCRSRCSCRGCSAIGATRCERSICGSRCSASWIVLVVLFFSLSTGKRGVYVLPAVPAFALLCAPYLAQIAQLVRRATCDVRARLAHRRPVGNRCIAVVIRPDKLVDAIANYDIDCVLLVAIAIASMIVCGIARVWRGFMAYGGVLAVTLLIVSFWLNPVLNDARSGADFGEPGSSALPIRGKSSGSLRSRSSMC